MSFCENRHPRLYDGAHIFFTAASPWAANEPGVRRKESPASMIALFNLIDTVISLYIWALIISAILSWLVAFNVINTSNRFVYMVGDFLYRITEPALRPIRNIIPNLGGIDISPVILILLLVFLRNFIRYDVAPGMM